MNTEKPEEETLDEDLEVEEIKKETKKYIHNCTKCGKCCEKWEEIPIYLDDLQRWTKDGTISHVLPFIQLRELPPAYVRLVIQKHSVEGEDPNPSGCPLYDYENKICNVYSSMPLHCAAYQLAYNGEKFYLVDSESPGLGEGTMTKESLDLARLRARAHFESLSISSAILPVLYTLILANIMQRSQEAMDSLSEDDRKTLDELLSKQREEETDETETEGGEN
ncbi:MAG: YkgJ family cysteine cluster protein [Candidatus Heimdallarchaeaceae archaeon]|jgi:Fe-S-cluster containining protein